MKNLNNSRLPYKYWPVALSLCFLNKQDVFVSRKFLFQNFKRFHIPHEQKISKYEGIVAGIVNKSFNLIRFLEA